MGLDWVIKPRPEEEYEKENVFRGQEICRTSLPEEITGKAYTDMSPYQMEAFAETLCDELSINESKYTDEEIETINEAIEWLQYWSNEERSVYAWY